MYTIIDVEKWKRKEIYEFFSNFEEPYFGITSDVDVTKSYHYTKENGISFFLWYLHKSMCAINQISALKYRIENYQVVEYTNIHASATINRSDGTFGFSFIDFDEIFNVFRHNAQLEIDRIRSSTNLFPSRNGNDCVHCSSLPWIKFTALSHARAFKIKDSVPKISFGKMYNNNNQLLMPCSIHVHHGLADGKDVGTFYELFQVLLNG